MRTKKSSKLYVYGVNVAKEILTHRPDQVLELYTASGGKHEEAHAISAIARNNGMLVRQLPDKKLKEYVGTAKHQGIVLKLKSFAYSSIPEMLESTDVGTNPAILIMEQIEDPHNVGAIIRSATALGMSGIVMLNHHQAPVNATSYKTSAGTIGRLPIARVSNIANTVQLLKKAGYWVAGLDMTGENITANEKLVGSPMAFIVGNEGLGLKESTKEHCDFLLSIPMEQEVESLNASVSAAIIMYEWHKLRAVS